MNQLEFYVNQCCKFGNFELTSGGTSDFYIDIKSLLFQAEPLTLIGRCMLSAISRAYGDIDCIGGLELGSVPLSSAISITSVTHSVTGDPVHHFAIRKTPRTHGTKSQIEGVCEGKVILVDDVLTTGGSLVKARDALFREGMTILGAAVVVDREEAIELDFPVISLFKKSMLREIQNNEEKTFI